MPCYWHVVSGAAACYCIPGPEKKEEDLEANRGTDSNKGYGKWYYHYQCIETDIS